MVGRNPTFLVPDIWHSAWHTVMAQPVLIEQKHKIHFWGRELLSDVGGTPFILPEVSSLWVDCYWNDHLSASGTCPCLCRAPGGLVYKIARTLATFVLCFLCVLMERQVCFCFSLNALAVLGLKAWWAENGWLRLNHVDDQRSSPCECLSTSRLKLELSSEYLASCALCLKDSLSPLLFQSDG